LAISIPASGTNQHGRMPYALMRMRNTQKTPAILIRKTAGVIRVFISGRLTKKRYPFCGFMVGIADTSHKCN